MADDLENLARIAIARIGDNSPLDEIEKAMGIAKAAADTARTATEAQNTGAQNRLEWFKALPALAVPIVSVLTLDGTIWYQGMQLQASRQQNEDTQWRDFLISVRDLVKESSSQPISDPTFPTRLKSFLNSPVYKSQVVDLAKRMMGNIANKDGFDDLFSLVFPDENDMDIADLLDLNRNINRSFSFQTSTCRSLSIGLKLPPQTNNATICDYNAISDTDLPRYISASPQNGTAIAQARHDFIALASELTTVSHVLAAKMGKVTDDPGASGRKSLDGIYVQYVNMRGVDFSKFDLSGATFDTVDLTDTVLSSPKVTWLWFPGSNWWDAKYINPPLLDYLIANAYPGFTPGEFIVGDKPLTLDYYISKIAALCKANGKICDPAKLTFNPVNYKMIGFPG